jgi:phosphoribosylaminoimidazolecarboxamide formyltransferase / IMP cyclohydrolase
MERSGIKQQHLSETNQIQQHNTMNTTKKIASALISVFDKTG